MYSRRNNLSEYSVRDDGRGYYFAEAASPTTISTGITQPSRGAFHSPVYEIHPYISSTDVHIFPESITVTPGRKTITVGRKESPQRLQHGDNSQRRPDVMYKTTMITQVTPRDGSCGRDSPQQRLLQQQQQHARSDSRLFHISVEPTSSGNHAEFARYTPSPDGAQRTAGWKNSSNLDWSSFPSHGQTHYLPCSPERMVEISFQHPPHPQMTMQRYQLDQQQQQHVVDQSPHQQPHYLIGQNPSQQMHHYYYPEEQQHQHHHHHHHQQQQQQQQQQQMWRGQGDFLDSVRVGRSSAYPHGASPQAVPSRLVYSPQTPNQSIAYSKKVEKKTPSHCSSITIVQGGWKAGEDNEARRHNLDIKAADQQRMNSQQFLDKEAEIDELTNLLVQNMQMTGDPKFFGMCTSCGRAIMGSHNGSSALGRLYHVSCFVCGICHIPLKQKPFFSLDGVTFCEHCYATTVERCSECNEPITDKMLRAVGKQFHTDCFKCCSCRQSLDGQPFTLDAAGQVFCLDDFNRRYAPRCSGCGKMIIPPEGRGEAERVVVLDRNYHLECHRCEDCGQLLSSRFGGDGCFPLDDSILCCRCNSRRMERLTNPTMTSI